MTSFAGFVVLLVAVSTEMTRATCPAGKVPIGPLSECVGGLCPPPSNPNVDANQVCECCKTSPTPTTNCVDQLGDCAINVGQCNVASYKTFMTQYCPKTCNRCSSSSTTTTNCVDQLGDCAISVGQCNVASYKTFMTQYCPKTCNRCPSG